MRRFFFPVAIAVVLAVLVGPNPALAQGFSLKKAKQKAVESGERYLLCLVSAELREKKALTGVHLPSGVEEVFPDASDAGLPWDIKVGPFSEDTDAEQLALVGVKYAALAAVPSIVGSGLIGYAAKQAVRRFPTGPDNETEPDAFGELRLGGTLMLRTDRVSGTTTPVWNHCAEFKRKHLVGQRVHVRVVDYDVVRLDPLAHASGGGRLRGDVAGELEGPLVTSSMLDRVRGGRGIEQTLRAKGDANLRSVTWRLEPVASSTNSGRRR